MVVLCDKCSNHQIECDLCVMNRTIEKFYVLMRYNVIYILLSSLDHFAPK